MSLIETVYVTDYLREQARWIRRQNRLHALRQVCIITALILGIVLISRLH